MLGTAAFASLGLFVAGVLRAEATLAAANLVYLLLMAGGAVVLPVLGVRRASAASPPGCPPARSATPCAQPSGRAPWSCEPCSCCSGGPPLGTLLTARTFKWE